MAAANHICADLRKRAMNTLTTVVVIIVAWFAVALVVGVVIGRIARNRDAQCPPGPVSGWTVGGRPCPTCGRPLKFIPVPDPKPEEGGHYLCESEGSRWDIIGDHGQFVPLEEAQRLRAADEETG
jgi:hypothetical protein